MKHNANVLVIMVLWGLIKDLFICKTKFVVSVTHCCIQSIFFLQKILAFLKHFFLLIDKTKFSEIIYFSLNKQTVSIYKIFLLILSSSQHRLQTSKIIQYKTFLIETFTHAYSPSIKHSQIKSMFASAFGLYYHSQLRQILDGWPYTRNNFLSPPCSRSASGTPDTSHGA